MVHLVIEPLIRLIGYPVFYGIGLVVVKGLSLGRANVLPYSELGQEEDAAWYEFRIRRWGFKLWRPESLIIIGGWTLLLGVLGYYVCRYLI